MNLEKTETVIAASNINRDTQDKWLTFWLQQQLFGLSIANVEQIVSMQVITEVPEFPSYAKGIVNLRGIIIPVIDLRLRLGRPETEYTDHTCIVINRIGEEQLGFIVDEVDAVIDIPREAVSAPPKVSESCSNTYLTGIARIANGEGKEQVVLCLDAAKVLHEDELQALSQGK